MGLKRYARAEHGEESLSRNIREMIEMIKREKVNTGRIKYKSLKMSKHATDRMIEYFGCSTERALKEVRYLLKRSKRVGEQLAYDGRINVMFVCQQYAIYLSPNLEYVVTIHKFQRVSYRPIKDMLPSLREQYRGKELRQHLVALHQEAWDELEQREQDQLKLVLEVDAEVSRKVAELKKLKQGYSTKHYKKYLKQRLVEEREKLVSEGQKLFNIKLEKRHVGKSITSVL